MHFFHNEMSLSLIKILMNYCLHGFYWVLEFFCSEIRRIYSRLDCMVKAWALGTLAAPILCKARGWTPLPPQIIKKNWQLTPFIIDWIDTDCAIVLWNPFDCVTCYEILVIVLCVMKSLWLCYVLWNPFVDCVMKSFFFSSLSLFTVQIFRGSTFCQTFVKKKWRAHFILFVVPWPPHYFTPSDAPEWWDRS